MPAIYKTSSGRERWRANWRDEHGAQHSKNFDDYGSALAYEQRMYVEREERIGPALCANGCGRPIEVNVGVGGSGRRRKFCPQCARERERAAATKSKREERAKARAARIAEPTPCANPDCNEMVTQTGIGAPRKFHSDECREAHWNKTPRPSHQGRKNNRHSIIVVDELTREATCSQCGPVRAYRVADTHADGRPRVRWVCMERMKVGSAESRARYRGTEKYRDMRMRNRYGITQEQLEEAKAKRSGLCDICHKPEGEVGPLRYEHDHDGGGHRGWLCDRCNLALGLLDDDPERLQRAAAYAKGERPPALAVHPEIEAAFAEACPPTDDPHEAPF